MIVGASQGRTYSLMLAFMGAGIVSMFFGMAMPNVPVEAIMVIDGAVGVVAGVWWIRHCYRVNHERKLVIDRNGITYFRLADRPRVMRWEQVERVTEGFDEMDPQYWLDIVLTRGKFQIRDFDFVGYSQIRMMIEKRAPSKTTLVKT